MRKFQVYIFTIIYHLLLEIITGHLNEMQVQLNIKIININIVYRCDRNKKNGGGNIQSVFHCNKTISLEMIN